MNVKDFVALKVGDKVQNLMLGNQAGEVIAVADWGVRVRWGASPQDFPYTRTTTAWMHWTHAPRDCPAGGQCTRDECRRGDLCVVNQAAAS